MPNWLFFYWELKQNPILINFIEENLISKIEYANLTNNYIHNNFNSSNIYLLRGMGVNQVQLPGKQRSLHPIFLGLSFTFEDSQNSTIFLSEMYKLIQEKRKLELLQYIINNKQQPSNFVYVQHTHNIFIPKKNLNNFFISSFPYQLNNKN